MKKKKCSLETKFSVSLTETWTVDKRVPLLPTYGNVF